MQLPYIPDIDSQAYGHTHTYAHNHTHTNIQIGVHTNMQSYIHAYRHTYIHTYYGATAIVWGPCNCSWGKSVSGMVVVMVYVGIKPYPTYAV